jgi:hypothetical protein
MVRGTRGWKRKADLISGRWMYNGSKPNSEIQVQPTGGEIMGKKQTSRKFRRGESKKHPEHWSHYINDPLIDLNPREQDAVTKLNMAADKKESKYHLQGKQSSMHLTLDMDGKDVLERKYDATPSLRVTRSLKTGRLSYKYIPDHKRVRNKEAERFADKIVETY